MLDLLRFDITARDRASGHLANMRSELGGIRGALAGVADYAQRSGRAMRNIGAGMSAGITAPLVLLAKQSLQLYDTQVKAEGAVAQAITSTGGAAGKTLGELKGLADALQEVTIFGDEDILRNVTAPLLTFTKVQGEVFDRAQANVLDMATLLKTDLKSAAILVGKALNDPIRGVGALSRSGVQFTESQKKVIKALVETGDVAGAQAVILQELETQFKGQAAAAAATPLGQWAQLSNAIGDVKEQLGDQVVPFLKPLVGQLKAAVAWFGELSPEVKKNVVVFGALAAVAGPVLAFLGLAAIGVGTLGTAIAGMGALLMANPIILALALIAGGAYLIYQNWDFLAAKFGPLTEKIGNGIGTVVDWVKTRLGPIWGLMSEQATLAFGTLAALLTGDLAGAFEKAGQYFDNMGTAMSAGLNAILGLFGTTWQDIVGEISQWGMRARAWMSIVMISMGAGITSRVQTVIDAVSGIWTDIKGAVSGWVGEMEGLGSDLIAGLGRGMQTQAGNPVGIIAGIMNNIIKRARAVPETQSPSRVFMGIGSDIIEGLTVGLTANGGTAVAAMGAIAQDIVAVAKTAQEQANSFFAGIKSGAATIFKDVLTGARSFKDSLSGVLGGVANKLIDSGIGLIFDSIFPFAKGGVFAGGNVVPFAAGGVVSGPTSFPMAGGRMGLMGEAGPEAIMPLARGPDGRLGVRSSGGGSAQGGALRLEIVMPEGFDAKIDGRAQNIAVNVVRSSNDARDTDFPFRVAAAQQSNALRRG